VRWLPLLLSCVLAGLLAPGLLRLLGQAGVVRENYRGLVLPAASGTVIVVAALLALAPLAALDELADTDTVRFRIGGVLIYVLGVAVLGLVDDLLGGRAPAGTGDTVEAPRGWRGHARAAAGGDLSTGVVKAVGALGLAFYVLAGSEASAAEYLLAVALLVLTTNLFNLVDLGPGRAGKAFLVLGAALTVTTWDAEPLQTLGLFVGPVLVLLAHDLREHAMLGDVGSNVIGALAGIWLLLALSTTGRAVALGVVLAITLYGEFRSISSLVEKNPLLRRLDSVGRRP
jgi:UDP-GlcNAc:undecaprenyl-phosphate GlcNAc-1-phosphate transferase